MSYTLAYADDAEFVNPTEVADIRKNRYIFPSTLSDGTYFWRVKAGGE